MVWCPYHWEYVNVPPDNILATAIPNKPQNPFTRYHRPNRHSADGVVTVPNKNPVDVALRYLRIAVPRAA